MRTTTGLAFLVLAFLCGCGGGGGSDATSGSGLHLKGTFNGGTHTVSAKVRPGGTGPASAINPADVAQIIGFEVGGGWFVAPVVHGEFDVEVTPGEPVGVIFAGSAGEFLGYLSLPNGLDSLPLTDVDAGLDEINLGVLSSHDGIVTPSIDPTTGQLQLTAEERTILGSADDAFSTIVHNPDANGNGVIDVLENEFWRIGLLIWVSGGSFQGGLTSTPSGAPIPAGWRMMFSAEGLPLPAVATFTGPPVSTLNTTPSEFRQTFGDSALYSTPFIQTPTLPPGGSYDITLSPNMLTFDLADQSTAAASLLLPVPTVDVDGSGFVNRISWTYAQGGNSNVSPKAVIGGQVRVQLVGTGPTCGPVSGPGFIYDSGPLPADAVEHVLSCPGTILWSNVTRVFIAYQDVYQNNVVVAHEKP